jgi:hypothetical protein
MVGAANTGPLPELSGLKVQLRLRVRAKLDRGVAAVAERFVLRRPTAANGHVVADLVLMTVRRSQHNAARS